MDIQLTVVDTATGRRQDVVVSTEPESTVGDIEREMRKALGLEGITALRRPSPSVQTPNGLASMVGQGQQQGHQQSQLPGQQPGWQPPRRAAWQPAWKEQQQPTVEPVGPSIDSPGDRRSDPALTGMWVAGRPVDAELKVTLSPLRHGAIVGLGGPVGPGAHDIDMGGVAEVRVVGGPDSGRVHRLPLGEYVVGSAHDSQVYIEDASVSPRQARLRITAQSAEWTPYERCAPAHLERREITDTTKIRAQQLVSIGNTRLMIVAAEAPDASLVPTDDGSLAYNRPPRLPPAPHAPKVMLPKEPQDPQKAPLSVIAMLAPLGLGAVMIAITKQPYFALMMLMSPVLMFGSWISGRRQGKKSHRQQMIEYREDMKSARAKIKENAVVERRLRRYDAPDPAAVLVTALGPRRRLWERRRRDQDKLVLRLGCAELMSGIQVEGGEEKLNDDTPKAPSLNDVPVTVALPEIGVLGVAGPSAQVHQTARWLVAQAVTLHSPRDLSLYVLSDEHGAAEWEWTRWVPHARPDDGSIVSITGTSTEVTGRRVGELVAMVAERKDSLNALGGNTSVDSFPPVLVILDGSRALRSLPGMPSVLQDGPKVGIYAICLDAEERLLPEECGMVAAYHPTVPTRLAVRKAYGAQTDDVLADQVSVPWCERLARALAPIRDAGSEEGDVVLPHSVRLLDLLGLEPPTPDKVLSSWGINGRRTDAAIGVCVQGEFQVDMAKDGPHALVAGTTGSGKSELLQSIIASLAVGNRPDAMTFVLIDYKGGAAFKDCVHLPHTVGMVTDLDGHLTERALASLNAELKRREHLLSLVGAKDIEDYWDTLDQSDFVSPTGQPMDPMPRLILIIDEFATLVEELGDFVEGLVGIAMRGRSLGVHLILATQRPSGVVSPVIRANTNLRIALRVTDNMESTDVIDAPDAARISKSLAGRALARTGYSALTTFQTGRVGGRRPGTTTGPPPVLVSAVSWEQLGQPIARPDSVEDESGLETDLQLLVNSINEASTRGGYERYRSPWLPSLPDELSLESLNQDREMPPPGDPSGRVAPVPFGVEDLPDEQAQRTMHLDLEHGSHLMVVGSPRSGRSTALRTIAGSIARYTSAADVHVYGLDCGNAALLPLTRLPHCGAVVTRDQIDRADRLITVLIAEVTRRQVLLAQDGFGSVAEQRAAVDAQERLPYLVLLLDRWEGFMATFDEIDAGRMTTDVQRLLREGPSVGLRVILGSDRSGLMGRMAAGVEDKLIMRMSDRNDYGLGNLSVRNMPDVMPPGRAFRNDSQVETHIALLSDDPSGPGQVAAFNKIADEAIERDRDVPRSRRAARVDVLPARIPLRDVLALSDGPRPESPMWALIGVGGDELGPIGVDLSDDGPGYVIGGPPRSGRSTALLTMTNSLIEGGAEVVVVTPRPSPLRELDGKSGVLGVLTGSSVSDADVIELLDQALGPVVVCVDDGELIVDTPAATVFESVLREGRDSQQALVIAGTTGEMNAGYRGYIVEARKSRSGFLITPEHPMEGDLLGIKPPRSAVGPGPRGRGLFVRRGSFMTAQVPMPDDEA